MSRSRDLAHERHLRYLKETGRAGYVPASPVRDRIRILHDKRGITFDVIADRSGMDVETIKMQYHGVNKAGKPIESCEMATRRAVLGARFTPDDAAWFPSLGIRRRLQALQVDGFTLPFLAGRLPVYDYKDLHRLMTGRKSKEWVNSKLARAIIDLHDQLLKTDPVNEGINAQSASRCRSIARSNGYVPQTCWDQYTYDDPDALPEWTGRCGTALGARIHDRENIPMCLACSKFDVDPQLPGFDPVRFRALRERKGWSRKALADEIGCNDSTLIFWENGRSTPQREYKIDAILALFDADFEDVYDMEDPGWKLLEQKKRRRRRSVSAAASTS